MAGAGGRGVFFLRRPLCAGEALVAQAAGPRILMVCYRLFSSRGGKVVAAQKGVRFGPLSKLGNWSSEIAILNYTFFPPSDGLSNDAIYQNLA